MNQSVAGKMLEIHFEQQTLPSALVIAGMGHLAPSPLPSEHSDQHTSFSQAKPHIPTLYPLSKRNA